MTTKVLFIIIVSLSIFPIVGCAVRVYDPQVERRTMIQNPHTAEKSALCEAYPELSERQKCRAAFAKGRIDAQQEREERIEEDAYAHGRGIPPGTSSRGYPWRNSPTVDNRRTIIVLPQYR